MSAPGEHADTQSAGPRAQGRELALVVLCHLESVGEADLAEARATLLSHPPAGEGPGEDAFAILVADPRARTFADALVDAWAARRAEIDGLIQQVSLRWRLDRMDRVDRNVLRLATSELLSTPETPRGVVLSEAVRLARRYGSDTSPGFVNGLLDAVAKGVQPANAAQESE
jgi:N utilization substance protein B